MVSTEQQLRAKQHNDDGNGAFKAEAFMVAVDEYSKAISADPAVAKYWTNRANAFHR